MRADFRKRPLFRLCLCVCVCVHACVDSSSAGLQVVQRFMFDANIYCIDKKSENFQKKKKEKEIETEIETEKRAAALTTVKEVLIE